MLLNLSKEFSFSRESEKYHVDYLFTRNEESGKDICLVMEVSKNSEAKKLHKVSKPTSTLYLSNEVIEHMIEEESVACSQ